jgi:hypothetical protein
MKCKPDVIRDACQKILLIFVLLSVNVTHSLLKFY